MNSIPLVDAIPWIQDDKDVRTGHVTTWLVNDSKETDGKFLMYSLAAAQARNGASSSSSLSSSSSSSSSFRRATNTSDNNMNNSAKIIWLSCGPTTQQEVAQSLKKAGCEEAAIYLRRNNSTLRMNPSFSSDNDHNFPSSSSSSSLLSILPVSLELANLMALQSKGEEKTDNIYDMLWNDESDCYYLRKLYQTVKTQVIQQNESNSRRVLIFIDDVSYLSVLFGNSMTFLFLQQIRSLISSHSTNGMLTIRCMNETDQQIVLNSGTDENDGQQKNNDVRGGKNLRWVGAGGNVSRRLSYDNNNNNRNNQFVRSICELANVIMDVMPLQSGFSREVHGRILFTKTSKSQEGLLLTNSLQQNQQQSSKKLPRDDSFVLNYCSSESGVKVMRLRS